MSYNDSNTRPTPRLRALIPFGIFILFYAGLSVLSGDFYSVPMIVAFLVAGSSALLLNFKIPLQEKVEIFAQGMGQSTIMTMCLIFILAGAFASVAKEMGAVDAAVKLALHYVPSQLLIVSLFLVACFISLAIGTSVGTVVSLVPIALGVTQTLEIPLGLCLGAVVGGAMFGDNLSMISDTTIAATRTQNVKMNKKFYANLWIALPAAFATLALYWFCVPTGASEAAFAPVGVQDIWRVLPYILVLLMALGGVNVMALLLVGSLFAGAVGLWVGTFDFFAFLQSAGNGALKMSETLIVALLAGGLLNIIRHNGGVEYLLQAIEKHIHGKRGGEFGIAFLVSLVNIFTANNTVAIVIAGPIAKDISRRFRIAPVRSASLLDTSSCVMQGILPYGAQILAAVGLAGGISAFEVLGFLWYPYLLALFLVIWILRGDRPKARKLRD